MNATPVSVVRNDSSSARFTMLAMSLRPLSVDVGTLAGNRNYFFWGFLLGLSVSPLWVSFKSNCTKSRACARCPTVSGLFH